MTRSSRLVLLAALLVLAAGVVASIARTSEGGAVADPSPAAGPIVPAPPGEDPTSPSTTAAAFPTITDDGPAPAVRTPTGALLPVTGGSPGAWEVLTPCADRAVVAGVPVHGAHVVIDPGHGGDEPGAVGPSGLEEKHLNLDVARRVRDLLRAEGATAVLTRSADIRLTLQTRAAIATALEPQAFLSIHHNAAPVGIAATPGSELYHQLADPESKRLAGLLWEELQAHLAPFGADWAHGDQPGARARRSLDTGDDFYGVLRHAQGVPTALVEAAYLTHPPEEALLRTEEFRQAEARAIADAVLRLVRSEDPGSGFVPTKEAPTPAGGGGGASGCEDPPLT